MSERTTTGPELRVLLVYPNPRRMSLVPGSLAIFAALLKSAGCSVELFDATLFRHPDHPDSDEIAEANLGVRPASAAFAAKVQPEAVEEAEAFRRQVERFSPHLIAVTCVESTFGYALSLLRQLPADRAPTILGGIFATAAPERALRHDKIDMVCVGDGEAALVELASRMRRGEDYSDVDNLYLKRGDQIVKNPVGRLPALDQLPIGDFEIFEQRRFYRAMRGEIFRMAPIETHRGCGNVCTFCNSPLLDALYREAVGQRYLRCRSIEGVRQQIVYFIERFGADYLFFWADDFFRYTQREIDAFCEMYSEFGLPFYCQAYPTTISAAKLRPLARVGLRRLGVGVEHGNEAFRRDIVRRGYRNAAIINKLALVKSCGVEVSTNSIIGFPDETPALVMDTVELNREIDPDTAGCSVFTPFRGTHLREIALTRGYLPDPAALAPSNQEGSILDMPRFTRQQIEGKRRTFALYVKLPRRRWPEIAVAEQLSPEGDRAWAELAQEYRERYC